MMNKKWLSLGIVALASTCMGEAEQLGIADMKALAEGLPTGSLCRFHEAVASNQFPMPVVHSLWNIKNIPREDSIERRRLVAARDFAGALFLRIEDWAAEMKAGKPAADPIGQFMDLADWVMKSPGYGNFFIAKRCHEIAIDGIGRALVDTNCPLEGVTNQFPRCDAWWKTPAGRAKILNGDVGAELFEVPSGNEERQQQYLDRLWAVGKTMVMKYSTPEMQAAFEGNPPPGLEDVSKLVRHWYFGAYETPFMRQHISFFKDDGKVTAKTWDAKNHEALIVPYREPQLPRLKCLAEFRVAIGYFPGEYVPNEEPATSKQKAAFVQAWTDYRKQKGLPEDTGVAVTAWEVYREIMSGTSRDEGSTP